LRHEVGVSGRIDLGACLGPALTACIGVTSRGVRASHGRHGAPKWPRRDRVIGRGYAERPSASHGELDARIKARVNLLVLYFVYS
jgi:hypothetical protein